MTSPIPFLPRLTVALLAPLLLLTGCTLSHRQIRRADTVVTEARPDRIECTRADHCATDSPLLNQARDALDASVPGHARHVVTLLDDGETALAARVNLIRAARRSIDVQTYIWQQDDVGNLMLDELVAAARRGVKVRILADQLFSFNDLELLAQLARTHRNFQVRLYNPTFSNAETPPLEFAAGVLCCFFKFNQRMHNKLVLVDDTIGITGGRNYQDRYFDWDPEFDYRDRDIAVGGPAAKEMADYFTLFWNHRRSKPLTHLRDVNQRLRTDGPDAAGWRPPAFERPERVARLRKQAEDPGWIREHLTSQTLEVNRVDFFSDLPAKTAEPRQREALELTRHIMGLIRGARHEVVLQTPYLVMSDRARDIFEHLHQEPSPPRVIVSTNSLASTDAFAVYAMSYKHKKRYLKDFGFEIYELKPHPADASGPRPGTPEAAHGADVPGTVATRNPRSQAPRDEGTPARPLGSTGSATHADTGRGRRRARRNRPVPLTTEGVRTGLHAKSIVVDGEFAMVGSHNFDPRSDHYNTESGVIVYDPRFARRVRQRVLRDTQPKNAWTIAPRQAKVPVLTDINQVIGTVSEHLPLFDIWPFRYATSYELDPGCRPLAPADPGFYQCYRPVGDFPQVDLPFKSVYTRLLTAFGVGLTGIL